MLETEKGNAAAAEQKKGKLLRDCKSGCRVWQIEWQGVGMYVKEGEDVDEGEATITELARVSTGLPIPQVYHIEKHGDETFMYLEAMPGERLALAYWKLPPSQQRALSKEIKHAVKRLHSVRAPPGSRVGGFGRKPLSAIFAELDVSPSLFSSSELNAFLRRVFTKKNPIKADKYDQEIAPRLTPTSLVLVHGDFWSDNILIEDGRLSAIIDFERAGFYPEWVETVAVVRLLHDPSVQTFMLGEVLIGRKAVEREEWRWLWEAAYGWVKWPW
ncbi:hypothetical protein JCM10213_004417 [Rhodosporidiobolus nylandii]